MLKSGPKAGGRLGWVDELTDEDLGRLAPPDAAKVRLVKLALESSKKNAARLQRLTAGSVPDPAARDRRHQRGQAKLDSQNAVWIRVWAAAGYRQTTIASAFKVSQPFISRIVSGRRWAETDATERHQGHALWVLGSAPDAKYSVTKRGGSMNRSKQNETVLVVEDEPAIRGLLLEILEDLGYQAIDAQDSVSGLCVIRSDARIDLLITDVGLPGDMNGRQMADAARQSRPDLKVLFITGYAEGAMRADEQLAPGMDVLSKPFALETISRRILSILAPE